jgi:hypothetical protein
MPFLMINQVYKMIKKAILLILFILVNQAINAQHTQTIRGKIFDKESQIALTGATVIVENTLPMLGTSTGLDGEFIIEDVPVGRQSISVSYLGYEPSVISNIQIISGKETILEIGMIESAVQLNELVIKSGARKNETINEMAMVSARMFSVEETSRYAASLFDPARMAQNYAGVSTGGSSSDLFNEIIVRGNSPRGVLWRMEGIEIPNPNHFGAIGNTGGGISMLSSNMLSNSDFFTGAFPAEYGNATSAVFDIKLRKGNNEKREYGIMLGILGTELSAEGPLKKGSKASYLVNLRYSTLSILQSIGINPAGDLLPEYGDASFHIYLPTQKFGQFSIFGLGGKNKAYYEPEADSTQWEYNSDRDGYYEKHSTGTIAVTHKYLLSNNSYLYTAISASHDKYNDENYYLLAEENYRSQSEFVDEFNNHIYRLHSSYTQKVDALTTLKAGVIVSHTNFDLLSRELDDETQMWKTHLRNSGNASQFQAFVQIKHRLSKELSANAGIHYSHFGLNNQSAIEPRLALRWNLNEKSKMSLAAGLHSKPEHPSFYYLDEQFEEEERTLPNLNMKFIKALHLVSGYEHNFNNLLNIKAELYFQHLYNVPVEKEAGKNESILNVIDIWNMLGVGELSNDGLGRNYGLDVTLEKYYDKHYYFMATASVFNSQYRTNGGDWFNTRFNSNYQFTLLGGKEFVMGKGDQNLLGINGKVSTNGGNRTSPINYELSNLHNEMIVYEDRLYEELSGRYLRLDLGLSYQINKDKLTHTIRFDIQNVTNRQNIHSSYYDSETRQIEKEYQVGLFPVLNYQIQF